MERSRNQKYGHVFWGVLLALAVLGGILCSHCWSSNNGPVQGIYAPHSRSHKKADISHRPVLMKPKHIETMQVQQPQNLWEYKTANPRKLLFQMSWAKACPRFTVLYLYFFEYTDIFLPLIHTVCPDHEEDVTTKSLDLKDPSQQQWVSAQLHQLITEFTWHWRATQFWTTVFVVIHTVSLSALELLSFWSFWSKRQWKTLPYDF